MAPNEPKRSAKSKWMKATACLIVLWFYAPIIGAQFAIFDVAVGRDRVKTYGHKSCFPTPYSIALESRYGVKTDCVGLCVVSNDTVWYVGVYNAIAKPLLNLKNGKDIFTECSQIAAETRK